MLWTPNLAMFNAPNKFGPSLHAIHLQIDMLQPTSSLHFGHLSSLSMAPRPLQYDLSVEATPIPRHICATSKSKLSHLMKQELDRPVRRLAQATAR